jgi:hypothetical protein
MLPRHLHSPLLGTGLVLAALALLALPLHRLTAEGRSAAGTPSPPPLSTAVADVVPATLRIHTIDPLSSIHISDEAGCVLYQTIDAQPGEVETNVSLEWHKGKIDLSLRAESGQKETAVFLTLLPDGREERAAHAIGSGSFDEILPFHWSHE